MMLFRNWLHETCIDDFMSKISKCKTTDGLKQLDQYYKKRKKEAEISDSDDIAIRDAIKGRHEELTTVDEKEEDTF